MFKKTITYTDYNDVERTETFYFNLTKAEVLEMELGTVGGLSAMIQGVIDAKDTPALIKIFKDLVLRAYGEKSPDGKQFIKIKDGVRLADEFAQTAAYPEIFMELATNDEVAAEFVKNITPKGLDKYADKADLKSVN